MYKKLYTHKSGEYILGNTLANSRVMFFVKERGQWYNLQIKHSLIGAYVEFERNIYYFSDFVDVDFE